MKKKFLALLLAALMVVSLLPTVVFAADYYDVYVNGTGVTSANKDDVLGNATVTFTPSAGVGTNDKLTLNGATLTTINYVGNNTLDIEVLGENTVTPVSSQFGIVTWKDVGSGVENTAASLNIYGEGSLTVNVAGSSEKNQHNGILVNKDLTIKNIELTINTGDADTYNRALIAGHDLTIDGATVNATVGASTGKSTNAISAYDVIIKNGADVTTMAGKSDDTTEGAGSVPIYAANNVTISGTATKVNTTAGQGFNSCGISAKNGVTISGGTVTATAGTAIAASVGILAPNVVTISGGTVTAKAGTGVLKAAIAVTADGVHFGTLTVGSTGKPATLTNAATVNGAISESNGEITDGALVPVNTAEDVVVTFENNSSSANIKGKIDAADFAYELVIPSDTLLTEDDHEDVLLGEDGIVTIEVTKHGAKNIDVFYTVDLDGATLTDGENEITTAYGISETGEDDSFDTLAEETKYTVYTGGAVKNTYINVSADNDEWDAAPVGEYTAVVVFNFDQKEIATEDLTIPFYFTFAEGNTADSATITFDEWGDPETDVLLQYSYDNTTWNDLDDPDSVEINQTNPKVYFRAKNPIDKYSYDDVFSCTDDGAKLAIGGNIMSLLTPTDFDTFTEMTDANKSCFAYLFGSLETLYSASDLLLPATTLAKDCYCCMFDSCTNLIYSPKVLPATTMVQSCYSDMFGDCTNMITTPEIMAETITNECFGMMFLNCEKIDSVVVHFTEWDNTTNNGESDYDKKIVNATDIWLKGTTSGTVYGPASLATDAENHIPETWNFASR